VVPSHVSCRRGDTHHPQLEALKPQRPRGEGGHTHNTTTCTTTPTQPATHLSRAHGNGSTLHRGGSNREHTRHTTQNPNNNTHKNTHTSGDNQHPITHHTRVTHDTGGSRRVHAPPQPVWAPPTNTHSTHQHSVCVCSHGGGPTPTRKVLRSTSGARWPGPTRRTRPWRSTSPGTWTGTTGWSRQSTRSTSARAGRPP